MLRIPAYCYLLSTSAFVLADIIPPAGASTIIQGGALAVLGMTVWYLMTKGLPAHTKALRDERDTYLAAQKETREDFKESLREITVSLDKLAVAVSYNRRQRGPAAPKPPLED